jgi:hypothetical protein
MTIHTATLKDAMRISEQLSPADQLRLIHWLSVRLRDQVTASEKPVDLLASAGLGAEIWQQIDVEAYIRQERASWED